MNLVYKDSSIQNSECYLSTPSKNIICKINGTDPSSASYARTLADIDELSFTVFRYINVDGQIIESNGYNEIKNNMYLYLTNFGWFKIVNEPEITTDTTSESKKVVAQSIECELLQYDLVGMKINTGETDSAEYLADNNIGANNLAKEYVTFYNPVNTQLSLLHLILEKVRGWEIGYVDESLRNKKFTFSIDSAPIYTFIRNELQQQAHCIFIFDNENYTINVYSIESFGQDTSIYLSMRNLANNIDITCDDNNIYTCYHVAGGENLENINRVNFGNSYIENLSWYMQEPYMNDSLKTKYQNWLDYREEKRTEYIEASKQYAYYYSLATDVKNRVPVSDLSNTWQGYTLDELNTYKDFYTTTIAAIQSEFGSLESEIQKYPVWYTYIQYKEILSNINIAIKNYGTPSSDIDFSENWKTNPELYGVDELSYKVEAYKEQLEIFKEHQSDFIDSSGNYKNWQMLNKTMRKKYANQQDYETKLESYIELNETYLAFLEYLDIRTNEYNDFVLLYEDFANTLKLIANDVLIENFHETFTEKELDTLNRLKNYTDYTNENILVLNTYDTLQELNAQKDLLRDAQEQLVISSQPQFNFSVELNNLLVIPEFQSWTSTLDVGVFIYLEVRKDYVVKLRVTEISGLNPFNIQENNLTLTFSNMVKGLQGIDDYNSLLGTSIGSSKNSIHSSSSTSSYSLNINGIELTTDVLSMIANSHVFQNKFDTIYSNSIISSEAKFNTAMVDNLVVKMAEIDEATIKDLKADSAFIKYLNSTLVVANEIKVDDLIAKMAIIDIAKIKELHSDEIFTNSLQALVTSSVESTVDLQFVKTLIAGHATISDLFTNNFVIGSDENGSICMNGSTMQFKDGHGDVYVQIGIDNHGGHSIILKDSNGNVLLNGNGITEDAITDELIVNDMIKKKDTDYNGISGDCLDIDSVVTQINNGTVTIKSSQIYFDEEEQSLNTKLSCMVEDINGNLETNYYTKKETPEQIISILGKTDISSVNGETNSIINKINIMERDCDKINFIISDGTTSSNMTLTNEFYQLVSDNITLSSKNILLNGDTQIGKDFILTADNIKVDDLYALEAKIGGINVYKHGLYSITNNGDGFYLFSEGWIQLIKGNDTEDTNAGKIYLTENGGSLRTTISCQGIRCLKDNSEGIILDSDMLKFDKGNISSYYYNNSIAFMEDSSIWFWVKDKVLSIDTVRAKKFEGNATSADTASKADTVKAVVSNSSTSYQSLPIAFVSTTGQISYTTGFTLSNRSGTSDVLGRAWLILGNDKSSMYTDNKYGAIRLYGQGAGYNQIENNLETASANRNYLPDKSGTFALTSDISDAKRDVIDYIESRFPVSETVTVKFQNSIGYVDIHLSNPFVSNLPILITPVKKTESYPYLTEYAVSVVAGTIRIYGVSSSSGSNVSFHIMYYPGS